MRIELQAGPGGVSVDQITTTSLGNHTYVVSSGGQVAVIDPPRDFERIEGLVPDDRELVAVCETHIHNDYVSGGFWLADQHDATYVLPADSGADYAHRAVASGDRVGVGDVWLEAIDSPGHTFHHASYVLANDHGPLAVFTGGSMLVAAVGRSDLLGDEFTDSLLRLQHQSVVTLADTLPTDVIVAPTHGAGSFCSASDVGGTTSTVGLERVQNPACTAASVDEFIETQKAGYGLYPTYYSHMAAVNLEPGPRIRGDEPPALSPAQAIAGGWPIVDVRPFEEFADGHIAGSVAAPPSDQDATYIGWTIPWNTEIVVVGSSGAVETFRGHLDRLGWDAIAGVVSDKEIAMLSDEHVVRNRIADFADLVATRPERIVDVRDPLDHAGGTINGAIPAHVSVVAREELDIDGPDVWVHCASGYRAMVATGFLERQGFEVTTVIDDAPADLAALL